VEYIYEYDSIKNGYNSDKGGGFKKNVYQYSLDGDFIETYEDLTSAANAINATKKGMSRACWSVNKLLKGYLWSFEFKEPYIVDPDIRKKGVFQYSVEGEYLFKYTSVSEASIKNNISKSGIAKCCRGERLTSGGYKWRYENDKE